MVSRRPARRTRRAHRWPSLPALRAVLAGLAGLILALLTALVPASAIAEPPPPFEPGDIISDDSFYNPDAMTAPEIQAFLEKRDCAPKDASPCLADFRMDTPARAASAGRCAALPSRRDEPASSIIDRVAKACTISPRVLLVLLQKEQSLLTTPSAAGYQRATGYACPDTAECDKRYFGFFNQVYRAAWQFREYTVHPSDWRYRIGRNAIQYHPDAKCGSSEITIVNQATANLYNYTPYQPDRAALAAPKGPGGPCSAFGNLNFSRLYQAWFGSPLAVRYSGFVEPCLIYTGGFGCPPVLPLGR
ncbi:hypothetical protein [Leifsonia sp. AG29]|uniref:hypothetical protein n=1 Tax=Leifsonia sp. AG29 TaxID=2598860 RepID=UPI001E342E03|nr:hypothetical protein [Leifsonia sp. AG29]